MKVTTKEVMKLTELYFLHAYKNLRVSIAVGAKVCPFRCVYLFFPLKRAICVTFI